MLEFVLLQQKINTRLMCFHYAAFVEKRIKEINELSSHIQKIVSHKDHVIGVLQKPHVGDFIRIEASYKRWVVLERIAKHYSFRFQEDILLITNAFV